MKADGAYEALFTAILGHVNPGDEVVIIEPYFDCYEPMVKLAGGTPVFISSKPVENSFNCLFSHTFIQTKTDGVITSADWKLDMEELKSKISSKTKAIIYNNPNNPLGKVFTRDEISDICKIVIDNDLLMISDEVYEHMVFDDNKMIR